MTSSTEQKNAQPVVKESVIRKMTRLAIEHDAVNLSQGFPNEGPHRKLRMALAHGVLTGQTSDEFDSEEDLRASLIDHLQREPGDHKSFDLLNQYSPPMGRKDVLEAIAKYYQRFYDYDVSPDDITVTLGATEAFASALRTVGRPGDKCVIFEPFHELYPSQCTIFYLEPTYVTLKARDGKWHYDVNELESALAESKMIMLNSPHNPTGKCFMRSELQEIVNLCLKHNVYIVTDEIYEHMCFTDTPHYLIPKEFPQIADKTFVCNSLGKSASATGWRIGWCLHPPHVREDYRGIHDQMVVMSPQPMQYASLSYLTLPDSYFNELLEKYRKRVQKLGKVLKEAQFDVTLPEGAYYLFVNYRSVPALKDLDPMDAALYLLKEIGVACVPGDNFYRKSDDGKRYLRFAACRSDSDLDEASERLQKLKSEN